MWTRTTRVNERHSFRANEANAIAYCEEGCEIEQQSIVPAFSVMTSCLGKPLESFSSKGSNVVGGQDAAVRGLGCCNSVQTRGTAAASAGWHG